MWGVSGRGNGWIISKPALCRLSFPVPVSLCLTVVGIINCIRAWISVELKMYSEG